jgi:hypothetical protein
MVRLSRERAGRSVEFRAVAVPTEHLKSGRVTVRDTKDIAFVQRPGCFRDFLRACAFRKGSAKDDFAKELLDDVAASKFIDCVPHDLDGLVADANGRGRDRRDDGQRAVEGR